MITGQMHRARTAQLHEETTPTPTTDRDESESTPPNVLRWIGQELDAQRAAVDTLSASAVTARLGCTEAKKAADDAGKVWANDSTAENWKRCGKAMEAVEQADTRLRVVALELDEARQTLAAAQREALGGVLAQLQAKASGVGLPLDSEKESFEAALDYLRELADALANKVAERNAAEAGAREIAAYLGVPHEVRPDPKGWALRGFYGGSDVRAATAFLVEQLGHGARGPIGSPLRAVLRTLDKAPDPPAPPVELAPEHVEEVCS